MVSASKCNKSHTSTFILWRPLLTEKIGLSSFLGAQVYMSSLIGSSCLPGEVMGCIQCADPTGPICGSGGGGSTGFLQSTLDFVQSLPTLHLGHLWFLWAKEWATHRTLWKCFCSENSFVCHHLENSILDSEGIQANCPCWDLKVSEGWGRRVPTRDLGSGLVLLQHWLQVNTRVKFTSSPYP